MKMQIPTKYNSVPAEIYQPIHTIPNLRVERRAGEYYELYLGRKVGDYIFYERGRTETISRYCHNCGCEVCATWPRPAFSFTSQEIYDVTGSWKRDPNWKQQVDAALRPFFERQKLQDDFTKKVESEKAEMEKLPCPVCGQEMFLWKENKNAEILEAYNKLKSYSASCDVSVPISVNPEAVVPIKTDIGKLKDYLLRVINVEKSIKFIQDRLLVLYILTYDVNREARFAQLYPIMSERESVAKAISELQGSIQNRIQEIEGLKKQKETLAAQRIIAPSVAKPREPIAPQKPILATPNLFNKKRVAAENAEKTNAYNRALAQYENELAQYPLLLEEANLKKEALYQEALRTHQMKLQTLDTEIAQKISAFEAYRQEVEVKRHDIEARFELLKNNTSYPAVQFKISLDKEIADAESLLKDLYIKKYQLYGTDIIFRKYRDLVAVSSFYEYLLSGRCEALDGVNGCYNLYESELRANRIINQLEQISSSMEQIKDNQYMLYSQLSEINEELTTLNTTTATILQTIQSSAEAFVENSAVIAYNSAVSAYYTKINAEIASSTHYIHMISW